MGALGIYQLCSKPRKRIVKKEKKNKETLLGLEGSSILMDYKQNSSLN